ncbi:MAG: hypothetical protein WBW32_01375 [Luteibacter sp.]
MFDALSNPAVGDYDPALSRLLLSPTIEEVRQTLMDVLYKAPGRIDTFTFFFAGHGGVASHNFYLWARNSRADALAPSAFSLSHLFQALHEVRPSQTNIIIDACNSGGLVHDLSALLKPESLGAQGTPGISLIATAAADQYALESDGAGWGTSVILDCIEGRRLVNDHRPTLDLFEIGRVVSSALDSGQQTPVSWGLNIWGAPRFCRNPKFGSDPNIGLREAIDAWPSEGDATIRPHYEGLWRAYTSVAGEWDARAFARTVQEVVDALADRPSALVGFIDRLALACTERARTATDRYRETEVLACLMACLLPLAGQSPINSLVASLQGLTGDAAAEATACLVSALADDRYALLCGGGISDLYLLPIRISKCLGWAAGSFLVGPSEHRTNVFLDLLRVVIEHYPLSAAIMSDSQAPYLAVAFAGIQDAGALDLGEQLASLAFHSLLGCRGQVTKWDVAPSKVFAYLEARRTGEFKDVTDVIERPVEVLTVLMLVAESLQLAEAFDETMRDLDHTSLAAFVTPNFLDYGSERMEIGDYRTWYVGQDIFTCSDIRANWGVRETPATELEARGAILCSLLFADRSPWFLLSP